MINGTDKFDLLDKFKPIIESQGWSIKDVKEINYGIQFRIITTSNEALIRIFEGKKGVRFDFSQVKDASLLSLLESLVSPGKSSEKKSTKTTSSSVPSNSEVYPEDMIGTDESGKGDFFGPLVIAGVYVTKQNAEILREIGVMDSKKLSDNQIASLAEKIKGVCPYTVVTIGNKKYNELYSKINNLNKLLAWGHARVIENLLEKVDCSHVLSDQFGDEGLIKKALLEKGKTITLFQQHKAEEIISVAAASIIARNEYVSRLNQLSTKYKMVFPKGASTQTVQIAKQFASQYNKRELEVVAKTHFKTMEQI